MRHLWRKLAGAGLLNTPGAAASFPWVLGFLHPDISPPRSEGPRSAALHPGLLTWFYSLTSCLLFTLPYFQMDLLGRDTTRNKVISILVSNFWSYAWIILHSYNRVLIQHWCLFDSELWNIHCTAAPLWECYFYAFLSPPHVLFLLLSILLSAHVHSSGIGWRRTVNEADKWERIRGRMKTSWWPAS